MTDRSIACCDIYREGEDTVLVMEMPGVNKDTLEIKVDGDLLIIHGKKNTDRINGDYRINEIRPYDYHHEFTIDHTIDREKVDAAIKNGVVKITLGTKESEKPRQISVSES